MSEFSPLADATAIETLRARYCRLLDTKDWAGFRELFTDDFVSDTSASGGPLIVGAGAFVDFVSTTLAKAITVHQVLQPEIEVTSATTARGVWAMQDIVRFVPGLTLHGHGHYVETYEKSDAEWRIASSTLTRLRMEVRTPLCSVLLSDRMRHVLERASRRHIDQPSDGSVRTS